MELEWLRVITEMNQKAALRVMVEAHFNCLHQHNIRIDAYKTNEYEQERIIT